MIDMVDCLGRQGGNLKGEVGCKLDIVSEVEVVDTGGQVNSGCNLTCRQS